MNGDGKFEVEEQAGTVQERGATDIFGVALPPRELEAPGKPAPLAAVPPAPSSAGPVVHEVVFHADPTSPAGSDALRQLLRSTKPATPPPPVPAPASDVGFTQLLRALNFDQPKPVPDPASPKPAMAAATPAPTPAAEANQPTAPSGPPPQVPSGGPMTQLLRMIDTPVMPDNRDTPQQTGRPDPPYQTAPGPLPVQAYTASSQVTSFPPRPLSPVVGGAPIEAGAPRPAAAPVPAATFTQLFSTLDTPPAPNFTQMFAEVESDPILPASAPPLAAALPQPAPLLAKETPGPARPAVATKDDAVSFTQMFAAAAPATSDASAVLPRTSEPPAPPAAPPSTFTQMFTTPLVSAPAPSAPAPTQPPPGSFTQLFQNLGGNPSSPAPAELRSSPAPEALPGATSAPGSFTQMFQTLEAPATSSSGFASQPAARAAPSPPTDPPTAPAGSFTQMFSTFPQPQAEAPRQEMGSQPPRPQVATPFPQDAVPPLPGPSAASLTQLLRTLDQSAPPPAHALEPGRAPFPQASQPGEFTSTFTGLNPSGHGFPPAQPLPPPVLPPVQPPAPVASEFTRILNASALRESALREGGGSALPTHAATAPASPQPWAMSAPSVPSAPAVPHLPQLPAARLPEMPKPASPPVGMVQQYLPLILILTILLLVAILITVVFLMKR